VWQHLMRHTAGLVRLIAFATLTLIIARPTRVVAQASCEAKRQSCTAECYARYFTIDPKRNECVARCLAEEHKCKREQVSHNTTASLTARMQDSVAAPKP
jgi:hypothetical protein